MWNIKKWQDDAIVALMVAASVNVLKEPKWKLAVLGAVYLVDGWWRNCVKAKTRGATGKAELAWYYAWHYVGNLVSTFIRYPSICLMLEGSVSGFVSSRGYNKCVAEGALVCLGSALMNAKYYVKQGELVNDYDGDIHIMHSHIAMVLGTCVNNLALANSFGGGAIKYLSFYLSSLAVNLSSLAVNSLAVNYVSKKRFSDLESTEILMKRLAFSSACSVAALIISDYCNFDKLVFKYIAQSVIYNTIYFGVYGSLNLLSPDYTNVREENGRTAVLNT